MLSFRKKMKLIKTQQKHHYYPLCGQFHHFFLQFVQDMKVWLVLFGILLELDHTLIGALLKVRSSCVHEINMRTAQATTHRLNRTAQLSWLTRGRDITGRAENWTAS